MANDRNKPAGNERRTQHKHVQFRHRIVYLLLKPMFRVVLWALYNFHAERFKEEKTQQSYFILSNHNCALDPVMLALSFRQPIYFIASDHIFRLGLIIRMMVWLVAPIPIVKSQLDLHALRLMIKVRQEGGTICLFPSGNRSFAGPEMQIPAATGKLVKHIKCPVLLYRFEGGYLTSPRWARSHRKGRMTGKVIREWSLAELEQISADEINRTLASELEGNPYLNESTQRLSFRGRHLAEYLERVLFVCPACHGFDTLRSKDSRLFCVCGFQAAYQSDGWLKPLDPKFEGLITRLNNISKLDEFQKYFLHSYLSDPQCYDRLRSEPLFSDDHEVLTQTERASHAVTRLRGKVNLFADRFELSDEKETLVFFLSDLGRIRVHGPQVLQFHDSAQDIVYELISKKPRSAYKYEIAAELLRNISHTDR